MNAPEPPPPGSGGLGRAAADVAGLLPITADGAPTALVLSCHDDGTLLLDALASVAAEKAECFEVVVVDDGSTDPATCGVLAALERAGVTVIHQEAGGAGRAFELGARRTRAPGLVHLDAAGLLKPGFVAQAQRVLEAGPSVAVVHDSATWSAGRRDRPGCPDVDLVHLLGGHDHGGVALVRRRALEEVAGWADHPEAADWELWVALAGAGWDVATVESVAVDRPVRASAPGLAGERSTVTPARLAAAARRHPVLYGRHLPAVLADLAAERPATGRGEAGGPAEQGAAGREAADRQAAERAELAEQRRHALSQGRREADEARQELAAGTRRWSEERRQLEAELAEARHELALVRAQLAEQAARGDQAAAEQEEVRLRAEAIERELAALQATRTLRWTRGARSRYERLRRGRPS